jgi:hypothetical protein
VKKAIQEIRRSLMTIVAALDRISDEPVASSRSEARTSEPRRKVKLSPARMKALKLQGAYMGALRSLGPRQKVQVKTLRAAKGTEAAIRLAKQLSRR